MGCRRVYTLIRYLFLSKPPVHRSFSVGGPSHHSQLNPWFPAQLPLENFVLKLLPIIVTLSEAKGLVMARSSYVTPGLSPRFFVATLLRMTFDTIPPLRNGKNTLFKRFTHLKAAWYWAAEGSSCPPGIVHRYSCVSSS